MDKQWALSLLKNAMDTVKKEYAAKEKELIFETLKFTLTGHEKTSYAELSEKLNLSVSSIKVSVHRLRKQYREALYREVGRTVSCDDEVEEELKYLFSVL